MTDYERIADAVKGRTRPKHLPRFFTPRVKYRTTNKEITGPFTVDLDDVEVEFHVDVYVEGQNEELVPRAMRVKLQHIALTPLCPNRTETSFREFAICEAGIRTVADWVADFRQQVRERAMLRAIAGQSLNAAREEQPF